ncbi:MAG: hypothetical protein HYS26_01145 [Candidatus Kaiserbacteria bacterium]|nr:MAG: hypothetical protein HYS26_01145 [Candidatus Kaiserbacteria bacterium]
MEVSLRRVLKILVYALMLAAGVILAFVSYRDKENATGGLVSTAYADAPYAQSAYYGQGGYGWWGGDGGDGDDDGDDDSGDGDS